jgi:hypothetical protein
MSDFHHKQQQLDRVMMPPRFPSNYGYRSAMDFAYDQEQFLKNMQHEKEQQYHRERYLLS